MKKLFVLTLMISSLSYAAPNKDVCVRDGKNYGGLSTINPTCMEHALQDSNNHTHKYTADKNIEVVGWKNLLFIKVTSVDEQGVKSYKTNIISGDNSGLEEIMALDISADGSEVYVLNQGSGTKSILIFKANRSGNVKPRIILSSYLTDAKSITLSPMNDEIYVLHNGKISSFKSNANSRSKREHLQPVNDLVVESEELNYSDYMVSSSSELFILDKTNKKVLMVDKVGRSIASTIDLKENNIEDASSLKYDDKKDQLVISNSNNKKVEFQFED
jgi:DNA-binding beta-propeller fold protein YncE